MDAVDGSTHRRQEIADVGRLRGRRGREGLSEGGGAIGSHASERGRQRSTRTGGDGENDGEEDPHATYHARVPPADPVRRSPVIRATIPFRMKTYGDLAASGDGGSGILDQVIEQRRQVAANLASIGHVVAVMSGKGGVGKSTVTIGLASALAARGQRVAVLDADLNGPSIPRLLGLHHRRAMLTNDGLMPPETAGGVAVMSTDLFLFGEDEPLRYDGPRDDAYTWRPTAEIATLRELLTSTTWGRRDWLLLDLPPGAERITNLLTLLPRIAGAVVVTVGSALSLRIVKKSVTVAKDHAVPIAGLVENMAGYACRKCRHVGPLFGQPGAAEHAAREMGLPFLGAIPHEPTVALAIDRGEPFDLEASGCDAFRQSLHEMASRVTAFVTTAATPHVPIHGATP